MRLVSKKAPFLLAGGALVGKRIAKARAARRRKRLAPRIMLAGAIGALGAGVASYVKKAKSKREEPWEVMSSDSSFEREAAPSKS